MEHKKDETTSSYDEYERNSPMLQRTRTTNATVVIILAIIVLVIFVLVFLLVK